MLIQVDVTGTTQDGAGLVTYVRGLIRGWRDAAFDDHWILEGTADLPDAIAGALGDLGEVHRTGYFTPLARIPVQQIALPLRTYRRRPDVILCTTPVVPMVTFSTPVVSVVHDLRHLVRPEDFSSFQNRYRRQAWRTGLKRSTAIIADSDRTLTDLATHYPFTGPKTRTVYLGSDHVPAPAVHAGAETGHGIAFARWANKRPDFAIQTWAALRDSHPGVVRRLHIIGAGGEERSRLHALAGQLGVDDVVVVHPFLPEEAFWELFACAGVVLFPSYFEGFGLPVLEAMRLRVPVVTWRDPAILEVAGDCAWYADPQPDLFAGAVAQVLNSPGEVLIRTEQGYERACRWTWRATAEQTREVLVDAVQSAGT